MTGFRNSDLLERALVVVQTLALLEPASRVGGAMGQGQKTADTDEQQLTEAARSHGGGTTKFGARPVSRFAFTDLWRGEFLGEAKGVF